MTMMVLNFCSFSRPETETGLSDIRAETLQGQGPETAERTHQGIVLVHFSIFFGIVNRASL